MRLDSYHIEVMFSRSNLSVVVRKFTVISRSMSNIVDIALEQTNANEMHSKESIVKAIIKCTDFSAKKHRTQMRKDGETPYINHPIGIYLDV